MMDTPAVSVVIATYNGARTIGRAVQSVLHQGSPNFELIVVDDGSTDDTRRVMEGHTDRRVRYIYQQNRGRCAARNAGAELATGSVLTFLDSDDHVSPDWLQNLVDGFDSEAVAAVCCGVRMVDAESGSTVEVRRPRPLGTVYHGYTGLFLTGTFAIRRDLFGEIGGYDAALSFSENTDLAHRLVDYLAGTRLEIRGVDSLDLTYAVSPTRNKTVVEYQSLLSGAVAILDKHGHKYERLHPVGYANFHAIAGLNALRLGYVRDARRHLGTAIRANPRSSKNYARYVLTLAPKPVRSAVLGVRASLPTR